MGLYRMYSTLLTILILVQQIQGNVILRRAFNARWSSQTNNSTGQYIQLMEVNCTQCLCQLIAMRNDFLAMTCQPFDRTCQIMSRFGTIQLKADNRSIAYALTFDGI
jgi:hypothetical protein